MTDVHVPENSRIVQASYLEKHSSKKDLIQRLRTLQQVLQEDESIEPDGDEFPGLAATCHVLSQTFLEHVDKQVRLYTVQCCMELFAIYAPEASWDTPEILAIFRQTIRQLANLAHTTASQPLFANYMNILDLLANVKIGVVLVELCKTAHPADDDEAALEVLAELVRTLLHSIRVEHPPQVSEYVVAIVNGIIDEYEKGVHIPVAILDELLACIGQGPTVSITKLQQNVPTPGTQPNPSYLTAATIVRVTSNKIATPLENLLNGLLNRQSHVVEASSISAEPPPTDSHDKVPDVYTIVYELHKVAPTCLATVLGTVTNGLTHEDTVRRTATVQLLGRIFVATPVVAKTHHASFGAWLGRAVDAEVPIRKTMVALLRQLVLTDASAPDVPDDIRQQAVPALCTLIQDVDVLVRLDAIQAVCDGAYHETARHGPASLLHAVGQRVSSKHKQERRNAVTGLAQLYFSRFLRPALVHVHNGGDDVELDVIRQTLHHGCRLDRPLTRKGRKTNTFPDADAVDVEDECYRWIPRKVMEALCFTDQTDSEMRSRVSLILDEILLGSDLSSKSSKRLTSTARAVGLVMIVDSIRDGSTVAEGSTSTPEKFLRQWLAARATLQMTLRRYLDARATKRQHPHGTEEALTADAKAAELLETVASLTAVPSKSLPDVLEAFHGIRDKHVFNILATITDPTHSPKARARALEDLPKRTKSLGDAVSLWVKNLARRCVMGDFVNAEIVNHCVLLAQECFAEGDIAACTALLSPVKLVADIFPALCAVPKTFTTLTEVFSECRNATGAEAKREIQETSIITTLSGIMSAAAATDARSFKHAETHTSSDGDDFRKELMLLCTRDGTPEQARNAVYTLAQLLRKESDDTKGFEPLLKALTSTTRMTVSGKESVKLVSVLSALAAFTDCAPALLEGTEKGNKAINFALECVLMGRRQDGGDEGYDSADEDGETRTPSPSSRKNSVSSTRKRPVQETPEWGGSLLEDESLSTSCRRLCAAIEFLVSYVRSTTLQRKEQKITTPTTNELPSQLFVLLTQIIQDHGLPTSNRDRRSCRSRQDRAALRQCASTHILRLCDSRLGLEKSLLTPGMWHTLGSALLDEELAVREGIFEEYLRFLKGSGPYGSKASHSCTLSCSSTPSLRLVSLVVLCTDGHACASHDLSNGNAANVGRMSSSVKATALGCIGNLRKLCDAAYAQCRAQGKDTEEKFEKQYKMMLMPEYSVPFACHLLSHRRETPCIEASSSEMDQFGGVGNDEDAVDREGQQKVLRRRLKYLLEPLVQSLGDGADNISFLLRMTEILAKHYHPVDISTYGPTLPRKSPDSSMESAGNTSTSNPKLTLLEGKLKTVCAVARDVLLSFVKKDVNLSTYPGTIQLPANLFRKAARGPAIRQSRSARNASVEAGPHAGLSAHRSVGASGGAEKEQASGALPSAAGSKSNEGYAESSLLSPSAKSSLRKRFRDTLQSPDAADTSLNTRVQFSPDVLEKTASRNGRLFGLSPIPKSNSPIQALGGSSRRTSPRLASPASSGAETLGTSPPSVLHGNMIATMASTAADDSTDKEYLSSPGTIGTMESKEDSGVLVVESESKEKTDGQDNALSYDSSTEFKTTSETQSTDGTLDSIHRQGSRRSPRNMNQDGTSKGRPRRACKPLGLRSDVEIPGASREKGQKRKSCDDTRASLQESPSTHRQNKCQLKVNRAGTTKASNVELGLSKHRSRVSEKMDELDFDFGDSDGPENRLVRRNQSKATATAKIITTKSVPGKKKSTASKALSKTRKAVLRSR